MGFIAQKKEKKKD